jgi:monoamine oxidase
MPGRGYHRTFGGTVTGIYDTRPWAVNDDQANGGYVEEQLETGESDGTDWAFLRRLYRHPGSLTDLDNLPRLNRTDKAVCVIGGGLAGLAAAYELANAGCQVTLLERAEQWGGRVQTCYFRDDGTPLDGTEMSTLFGEYGPMRIPPEHGCVLHYVDQFELGPKRRFVQRNGQAIYHLLDERKCLDEWEDFSFVPPAPSPLRARPDKAVDEQITHLFSQMSQEERKAFYSAPLLTAALSEELRLYDEVSLWQHIKGLTRHPALNPRTRNPHTRSTIPDVPLWTNHEWELIGRATGLLWEERSSLIEAIVDYTIFQNEVKYELPKGMASLVQGFVSKLRELKDQGRPIDVRLGVTITDVQIENNNRSPRPTAGQVQVRGVDSEGSENFRDSFSYVVCCTPAPCTAQIDFHGGMPPAQRWALTNVHYMSAAKSIAYCSHRHWEREEKIFGGGSYTDLLTQQCWYPSDSAEVNGESWELIASASYYGGRGGTERLSIDQGRTIAPRETSSL